MKHTAAVVFLGCLLLLALALPSRAGEDSEPFARWGLFAREQGAENMIAWMRCSLGAILAGTRCTRPPGFAAPPFYGQFGIFVTVMKNGRVRGCYGAFDHRTDRIEELLRDYLRGALKRDRRYRPLEAFEAADAGIVVTVAGRQVPVDDIDRIDPANDGVAVTFESGEKWVFVPAEIGSVEHLKRRLSGREILQLNVFKAVTIKSQPGKVGK